MREAAENLVVFITAGSQEEGERIARALVREMLAACVNIVPGVSSVYYWAGEVKEDSETLLIVKTHRAVLNQLIRRVKKLHSYELPEIIALPIIGGAEDYLQWLSKTVHKPWHDVE